MRNKQLVRRQFQQGFTLVEIAVAVLILAIGILGVAGMQSVGVRESQNTYFRSQAILLVGDMAGKMRANAVEAKKGDGSAYLLEADADACDMKGDPCSSTEIAGFDLAQWEDSVTNSGLPGVSQVVSHIGDVKDGSDEVITSIYDIQVFWDEAREGSAPENCEDASGCVSWRIQI